MTPFQWFSAIVLLILAVLTVSLLAALLFGAVLKALRPADRPEWPPVPPNDEKREA